MKIIESKNAPAPVGPYSQAIQVGSFLFCSGQIALDPKTGQMVGKNVAEQAEQVMENIKSVLSAADLSMKNIIKSTIFLIDMNAFAEVNKVYEAKLSNHKPARSTVAVSALPKGALVEIEVIASVS